MAELMRCSITVEAKGRPLHPDKSAKEHGLRISEPGASGGLPALLVLGFKRTLCFTAKDVRQVIASRLAEGRLAFVSKDGIQVVLAKAQQADLEATAEVLRGNYPSTGSVAATSRPQGLGLGLGLGLGRGRPRPVASPLGAGGQPPPAKRACSEKEGKAEVSTPEAKLSVCCLPQQVLTILWDLEPSECAHRRMAESCKQFAAMFDEKQTTFRLSSRARGVSLDPERIFNLLARHSFRTTLDLSGFAGLTPGATIRLAEVLSNGSGIHLQRLHLRGCKALGDVAVRRLLLVCPRLEVLDLLEIPRLGSRALEAPLPELRVLAAGSLGRPAVAERPRSGTEVNRSAMTNISGMVGSTVAAPKQKVQGSMQITAVLLNRLSQRPAAPSPASAAQGLGGAPLTHVVLANCAEIQVFPRLPQTLRHLDLRDASIQVPDAALAQWRPLAGCPHLAALCLAGNELLSCAALQACIGSLPPSARLRVLDLSGTHVQAQLSTRLPQLQPALTHLRLAGCVGLRNGCAAALLAGLRELEVLDLAGCPGLEEPFAAVAEAAAAEAAAAARAAQGQQPAAACEHLRLLGVGRTDFGAHLEATRRGLNDIAPSAQAVPYALDIFDGYAELPPILL